MKKCYWCAEEIQDEARICRYCGRDVVDPTSVSPDSIENETPIQMATNPRASLPFGPPPGQQTDNSTQQETHELPPLEWHQRLIWRSIFFGITIGIILFYYVLGSTSPLEAFGFSGYFSNAAMQGFSNVVIYTGLYLLLGSIYRGSSKNRKYVDLQQRRAILRSEFMFVIGVIFLLIIAFIGIEKVVITAGNMASAEPTIMNISTETISPTKNATPTKKMATPTAKVSTKDPVIGQQERALMSSFLAYEGDKGWTFTQYLDDLDLVINGNAIIITLLKSPVTEADFKQVAYELIRVTAYHVINGSASFKRSDWKLDFNVNSIRVITKNMADYTIAGYVEGYENIKKMTEEKNTRDLVTYEKYY